MAIHDESARDKVKEWISDDAAGRHQESIGGSGGWFNADTSAMRWRDFIADIAPEQRPYHEAIRESVVANGGRIIRTARTACRCSTTIPSGFSAFAAGAT